MRSGCVRLLLGAVLAAFLAGGVPFGLCGQKESQPSRAPQPAPAPVTDIRVVSNPVPGGIRVDFVVQENLFFNQLIILGIKAPPSEASAAATMQITFGD